MMGCLTFGERGSFLPSSAQMELSALSPTGLNLLNIPITGRKETHASPI
ncbi:MAG: hypothetical protein SOU94_04545 [Acidaminococcus sp.]|uniref:Uncharacterized protein n=1 Tax=Acidaminococcus intestini TaxID=187327 RepID=A0A943I1L8_9FIRM|nr:hypothetical protein [Acidaminococcus sp.]MBS5518869.1 hypothetical protein [Acidaminococcus intestini]MDY2739082.1 hypothetical protein [Acidaminococcus sp.]